MKREALFSLLLALSAVLSAPVVQGAVRLEVPEENEPPFYAMFGYDPMIGDWWILHDEEWAAIPFYRSPAGVPPDFNLVSQYDVPRCFDCPLTIAGFEIWSVFDPTTQVPVSAHFSGPAQGYPFVAIYLVKYDELLTAVGDGELTIGELDALPSLKIGQATFFEEINGIGHLTAEGKYTSYHYELRASGTLAEEESKTFSVHFTTGGRVGKAAKAYPDFARAEVRFGK